MIVVVGTIAIPALLAWAVAIELGEQVRQKLTGRRGDDPFNMGQGKL